MLSGFVMVKEEAPEECRPCAVLDDLEPRQINEEQEDVCISQRGKRFHSKEEIDAMEFPITAAPIKSEDDEQSPMLSQLYQYHIKDRELPVENDGREESVMIQDHDAGSVSSDKEEQNDAKLSISEHKHLSDAGLIMKDMDWKEGAVPESDRNIAKRPSGSSEFAEQFVQSCCFKKDMENSEMVSSMGNKTYFTKDANVDSQSNVQMKLKFRCEDCGKFFSRKSNLNKHTKIHTGHKPFRCDVCGQRFSQKGHLNTHMIIHTGQKPFHCDLCGQSFNQKGHLNTHMIIHTGQRAFCCNLCGHKFSLKSTLNRHMRIHTGLKPFCCDLCGQSFSQKGVLNAHIRIHTGQKPFSCDLCGQSFSQKGILNAHKRVHTGQKPFRCDLCGQTFSQKGVLNAHMRIHTGQKPFRCDLCGQTFSRKDHFNKHMRIHTGQKPFCCDLCGHKFSRKSVLKKHMRIHT